MTKTSSQRTSYFLGLIAIILLLCGAEYIQIYQGVNPCPLCILQRLTLILLGIIFLLGVIFPPRKWSNTGFSILSIVVSALGIFLAGRQIWLQHLPTNAGANCEVSLEYLVRALPLDQVITKIFAGSSACSQIGWEFMGVSLSQWSLASFIVLLLFSLRQFVRK